MVQKGKENVDFAALVNVQAVVDHPLSYVWIIRVQCAAYEFYSLSKYGQINGEMIVELLCHTQFSLRFHILSHKLAIPNNVI